MAKARAEKQVPSDFDAQARAYVGMLHLFTHPEVFGPREVVWSHMSKLCAEVAAGDFTRTEAMWDVIAQAKNRHPKPPNGATIRRRR